MSSWDGEVRQLGPNEVDLLRTRGALEQAHAALARAEERAARAEAGEDRERARAVRYEAELAQERAECLVVVRSLSATIERLQARLRRLAWAEGLIVGSATLLAVALAVSDWATRPRRRVTRVGRRVGPSDRQLAAVAGVLVAFAMLALLGLGGW